MPNNDFLVDELRRVEQDVVQGERQLAEQEALLVKLKRENKDFTLVERVLREMRERQLALQQYRLRVLSPLQR